MARPPERGVLLAVPQSAVRRRCRWVVARSRRWARCALPAGAHPDVLGGVAPLATRRASVRLAPQRLRGHAAVRRLPVVRRRLHDVGDAADPGGGGDQRRPVRHAVLGTDIGGFVPTAEYTGELHVRWFQFGAFCPLFRAHGRDWHLRLPWGWNTGELGPVEVEGYAGGAANPDSTRAAQRVGRADLPEVPRAALSHAPVHLHRRHAPVATRDSR